ncbi:hypothetical protein [Scytonema sp. PCC 10023]|uniref:hypothetical protein n=1 Tax=Scytonema sp. PCC 10023 TaxID=1680591 RepID=UPI0039C70607
MAQIRVVLDPKHQPKAEAILEQTGISTLSQLFSLLIVNYGDCLVNALKAHPTAVQAPIAQPKLTQTHNELPKLQPKQLTQPKQFAPIGNI